jgi:pimeloyl-ACP methyl ester carboxylesterase
MPFVQANGLTFHVQELGAGPPVVMIHGLFFGNLAPWYFFAAPELARRHTVLLYDMRGHGKSDRPATGYDLATMTSDLAELAGRYDGAQLDLVGHSYGSLVALRFALDHPGRVRRLVLVEAPLPPHSLAETQGLTEGLDLDGIWNADELRERILSRDDADAILDILPQPLRPMILSGRRGMQRAARNLWFLVGESSMVADLRAEPDIPDEDLRRLGCPTLCIFGSRSKLRSVGDRLERVIPGARLVELDGGHYLVNERPRELAALIAGFLDA